jgi:GT2 family glycosyltransferase
LNALAIIIAYNGDAWIPKCLDSYELAQATLPEVLLVDNHFNTIIPNLKTQGLKLSILKTDKPLGFAEANNFALSKASIEQEFIVFLNQDTISKDGWVDKCIDYLKNNPSVGAVSPYIRTYDDRAWDPSFLDCLPSKKVIDRKNIKVSFIPAPGMVIRNSVLQQTGPFDPIYGSYYEDYDLCYRISKAGYELAFCGSAEILHYSGSATDTPEKESKRRRVTLRNRAIFRIRTQEVPRLISFLKIMFWEFPQRMLRGILKTPSSQRPNEVLGSWLDLWSISWRLLNKNRDAKLWNVYLEKIGWANFNKTL